MSFLFPFTTLSFAYPWVFLLPFLLLGALLTLPNNRRTILVPAEQAIVSLAGGWRVALRAPILYLGTGFAVFFLAAAAARPQKITILPAEREARNLMLILDVSRSMEIQDVDSPFGTLSRMDALKLVLAEFVDARKGDRIGIVVFGEQAFLQAPLTTDHTFLKDLIEQLHPRMAGDGTAVGEGLGVGLRRIQDVPNESRAMILLTDGVSNAGNVNPIQGAQVARDLGVVIHTIGLGSITPVAQGGIGGLLGLGQVRTEFDEKGLQSIAKMTGGLYRNASSLRTLQYIYAELDRVERTKEEEPERRLIEELFPRYLALALLLLTGAVILSRSVFLRAP
jgi:Ca-activated chloride channel family protein